MYKKFSLQQAARRTPHQRGTRIVAVENTGGGASFGRAIVAVERLAAGQLFRIWACALLIVVLLLVLRNLLALGFLFEQNYNEGWNVFNTARLIHHELIYDNNYWRVNNYPIGSFLIVATVNLLINNLLLSGRIVALLSFASIGVLAGLATQRFGGKAVDAVFGAACALGFCYLVAPAWIMVDDPQTLAEAVMLGGLISYLSRQATPLSLLGTASLVVLGEFTKHNSLAIPIAITLDLAIRSPRRLPLWVACCGGWISALLAVTHIIAGGGFLDHLLSPRLFTWQNAEYHLMKYLRTLKFPLFAILIAAPRIFTAQRFVLAAWGAAATVLGIIFSGFEGTSYNMFQDAAVFLGVAAGVMVCELRKAISAAPDRDRLTKGLAGLGALLVAQPVWARTTDAVLNLSNTTAILSDNRSAEEQFIADARYISANRGPAICESLLLCYVAGQPFLLDPFNSRQYILAGKLDETELIRRIAGHEFAAIQLRADICDDPATPGCHILHYPRKFNRFTDETLYAIDRYYKIERRSRYGSFYVPRSRAV